MNIKGIHHLAIKCGSVEKFEESVRFYHEILTLPIARTWGSGEDAAVMIDTGAGMLEIFASGPKDDSTGIIIHFAFDVDDTDACIEAVRAAGYKITEEPKDIVIPSEIPYPARIAFCIGPNGEEVEFFQVK